MNLNRLKMSTLQWEKSFSNARTKQNAPIIDEITNALGDQVRNNIRLTVTKYKGMFRKYMM
jgi:hypothetical protein